MSRKNLFVTIDQIDSFVAPSPDLLRDMGNPVEGKTRIFVFREKGDDAFCFCIDPKLKTPTQINTVLRDPDHGLGFETLKPTASYIFYQYGIDRRKVRLAVERRQLGKLAYWKILNSVLKD